MSYGKILRIIVVFALAFTQIFPLPLHAEPVSVSELNQPVPAISIDEAQTPTQNPPPPQTSEDFLNNNTPLSASETLAAVPQIAPAPTTEPINLPGSLNLIGQSSPNDGVTTISPNVTGIHIQYTSGQFAYSAMGGWSYDSPVDLSSLTEIVVSLKGQINSSEGNFVNFFLRDGTGGSAYVQLTGVNPDAFQKWTIPSSAFSAIDLTKVKTVEFWISGYNVALSSLDVGLNLTPGDTNLDGKVDAADYSIWADHYLKTSSNAWADGDFTGDGKVDGADYTIWADHVTPDVVQSTSITTQTAEFLSPTQKRVKELMDRNEDEIVSAGEVFATMREYLAFLKESNSIETDESLAAYDINKNNYITVQDMNIALAMAKAILNASELELLNAFLAADQDHDYILKKSEADLAVATITGMVGKKSGEPGFNALYDFDQNGVITAAGDRAIMIKMSNQFALPNNAVQTVSNPNFFIVERNESASLIFRHVYDVLNSSGDVITTFIKSQGFLFATSEDTVTTYSAPDASPDSEYLAHGYKRHCTRASSGCGATQVLEIRDAGTGELLHKINLRDPLVDEIASVRFDDNALHFVKVTYESGDVELYDAVTGNPIDIG